MNLSLRRAGFLTFVCTLLFFAVDTWAQTGTSTIRGEISDAQGKMIGGAAVTLKNPSTGFTRSQTTGTAGGYSFGLIPPADYVLEVESKGFKKGVRDGTALEGDVRRNDGMVEVAAALSLGAIHREIESLGDDLPTDHMVYLPLKDRYLLL